MSGNNGTGDAEFDAFASTGIVEGEFNAPGDEANTDQDEKPKRRGPPREAPKTEVKAPAGDADDADDADDDQGGDEDEEEKPKLNAAQQQINRLKREKSDLNRRIREMEGGAGTAALASRLESVEARLTGANGSDTKTAGTTAPDPTDTDKYPLGHLDDRYIEDKLEWLAEQKANKLAEAGTQRERANEQQRALQDAQTELLGKVDTLAEKGSEISEDFQEVVVEAGMRGDWKLTQTTFEAAHDAEHGAQILYDLANDPKEADRVAKLSPLKQLSYVLERDTEIGAGKKGRTKPQAGDPPKHLARGANSRTQGNPATNDLDDFEAQWEREVKGKKR